MIIFGYEIKKVEKDFGKTIKVWFGNKSEVCVYIDGKKWKPKKWRYLAIVIPPID